MSLTNHILRDLKSGPSTIRPLVARLKPHTREAIELELEELARQNLIEKFIALETIAVYRIKN